MEKHLLGVGNVSLHPIVLKELADHFLGPLHVIFQWFWESGKVSVD